ncbi:ribosome biogenesis GTPase Der [Dethiosulfovibrio sp. F2B]|uniref:ribosome biogenesis GTPase Der n=1 Tax=Dethiosulfovibrio faecalis TaxID=2720018 RepID=UPI001F0243C3|nr:ribosome biogenesis GTPase Der [Dethiosulfovibrio faecalis]MCF4150330.1 ribosome biogenesis GTPase Der [Dethiosulfovibrio faecalis]
MAIVTIVGRPNVGKSSLFNRLIGERRAIVDDVPGVTRDRLYGQVEWRGNNFYLVDTGGLLLRDEDPIMEGMKGQILQAMEESDVILLSVDGREGLTWMDEDIAMVIRKGVPKPVIVVVNKLDDMKFDELVYEAYGLGFKDVVGISAIHARGIDDLLDRVCELLPEDDRSFEEEDEIKVALVGRPNVGKSSILNRLLGENRSLVSDVPGTTRDSIDSLMELDDGRKLRLIDTAGLRRKSRFKDDIEYYSFVRTMESIDRSDVAILVVDAVEGVTDQDKKLASSIVERGKGIVLVMNKWDLLKGDGERIGDEKRDSVRDSLVFVDHAPLVFCSALTGRGVGAKLLDAVLGVYDRRKNRFGTTKLNGLLRDVLAFERLPSDKKGKLLRIYYCTQAGVEPPMFVFFVNDRNIVTRSFENHMINQIRRLGDYDGVPIRLFWRNSDGKRR